MEPLGHSKRVIFLLGIPGDKRLNPKTALKPPDDQFCKQFRGSILSLIYFEMGMSNLTASQMNFAPWLHLLYQKLTRMAATAALRNPACR